MTALSRKSLARLCAGAFLTLLAGGLLAPPGAVAACGNHAARGPSPIGTLLDAEAALRDGGDLPALPADPDRPPLPCSGSMCSGGPIPMVPAPPAPVRGEQWGCLAAPTPPVNRGVTASLSDESFSHPIRRGVSIERPPRPL